MRELAEALGLAGVVDADTLEGLVAQVGDGDALHRRLVDARLATERDIATAIAMRSGHRFVELAGATLDPETVALIPASTARRYKVLPLQRLRNRLILGMLDPTDLMAVDDVSAITDLQVEAVVVDADALREMFDRYLRSDGELHDLSAQMQEGDAAPAAASPAPDAAEVMGEDSPVIRFVNLLISQAIDDRASDIHIEPGEAQLLVRYRIDGVLHEMQRADRSIQDGVVSRLKIMASMDIAEKRRPQDGRLSVRHGGRQVDLRVATLPTVWGEKVVLRIMDTASGAMTLADLQFSRVNEERFLEAVSRPHGMVLVTGPTGSGKSTTLHTALRTIVSPRVNVITVEDPVEARIEGVSQIQVNVRAGVTFDVALRSILRADPDIVLVGEIRDGETATIAVEASLTGHLLLSTLHTNDAASAVTRMVEIGCEPYLVASALHAVVAQRLARRLCTQCRVAYDEDAAMLRRIGFTTVPDGERIPLYRAKGCAACSGTGYRGRVALHEVMVLGDTLQAQTMAQAPSTQMARTAIEEGMVPLREDGFAKALAGHTTVEEVLRVSR